MYLSEIISEGYIVRGLVVKLLLTKNMFMLVWLLIQSTSKAAVRDAVATPFAETEFIGESFPRKETGSLR